MSFDSLGLSAELVRAVSDKGYSEPTPVQHQAIPVILEGRDILAGAQTGTGKTAGFTLPMLQRLCAGKPVKGRRPVRALVLTPTRELAAQVGESVEVYGRHMHSSSAVIFGGVKINPQIQRLRRGVDILVATPGRLLDHVSQGTLDLSRLEILVLDEADRMLDMGFHEDMMRIIDFTPRDKQTLLFSATYPDEIQEISNAVLNNPVEVRVESTHDESKIEQIFYEIQKGERTRTLVSLLQHYGPESTVVFCNRKQEAQELADDLWQQGFHALALHGDLDQKDRDQTLVQFANRSTSILVATDVAARGLDIKDLECVVNFELTPDPEVHIHRIGRTGRAGKKGLALSLFMPSEVKKVNAIEDYQDSPVRIQKTSSLTERENFRLSPPMVTLCINGGRKDKVRPGDILGALTANKQLPGKLIGKIDIFDHVAFVAVERPIAKQALKVLAEGKIKGRKFRVRKVR
jgi:ATP-independent RNA helicase DbpA